SMGPAWLLLPLRGTDRPGRSCLSPRSRFESRPGANLLDARPHVALPGQAGGSRRGSTAGTETHSRSVQVVAMLAYFLYYEGKTDETEQAVSRAVALAGGTGD